MVVAQLRRIARGVRCWDRGTKWAAPRFAPEIRASPLSGTPPSIISLSI
jgi:hypothetical protein